MRKVTMLTVIVAAAILIVGCPPTPRNYFTFTFGNIGNEVAYDSAQLADGSWAVLGSSSSATLGASGTDMCLVHCDSTGSIDWYNVFGLAGEEVGQSLQQTSDGGIIMAGWTTSPGSGYDMYLVKATASGTQSWADYYGGDGDEVAYAVQQTSDGGFILAGSTNSEGAGGLDVFLVKTLPNGTFDWSKTFGGPSDDEAFDVRQTSDGGYIVAGYTKSAGSGGADIYLFKTDSSGNQDWDQLFGGASDDYANGVRQTTDGGYIVGGSSASAGAGGTDAVLLKTNSGGAQQWAQHFGGPSDDSALGVQQTSDGGYVLGGTTASYGSGGTDHYIVKTNSSGTAQWSNVFGRSGNEAGRAVTQASDGGYALVGQTDSFGNGMEMYVVKTNSSGTGSSEPVWGP